MTVPYSSPQAPFLGQIKDVNLQNVQNDDILQYDNSTRTWKNSTNSSGVTGTDDAALFKTREGSDADSAGITRDPTLSGYTINLDTVNKYVGINKVNPTYRLDVDGSSLIGTIEISNNYIGNTQADENINIYSHNQPNQSLIVDSFKYLAYTGGFRTREPDTVDTILPEDKDSFYKVKLSNGIDKWDGTAPFDLQNNYGSITGFPTEQVVEYQNRAPITGARIISTIETPIVIPGDGNSDNVTGFGRSNGIPNDPCVYDPMQMRTRKIGAEWKYAGAPTIWRQSDTKLIFKINWFILAQYPFLINNAYFRIILNQYRSGVLLRTLVIYESPGREQNVAHSGHKTLLSHTTRYNEDVDPSTDDFDVTVVNNADLDEELTVNKFDLEIECFLAQ